MTIILVSIAVVVALKNSEWPTGLPGYGFDVWPQVLEQSRESILEVFTILLAAGILAYLVSSSASSFLGWLLGILILLAPIIRCHRSTDAWSCTGSILAFAVLAVLYSLRASIAKRGTWIVALIQGLTLATLALSTFLRITQVLGPDVLPAGGMMPHLQTLALVRSSIGLAAVLAMLIGSIEQLREEEGPRVHGIRNYPRLLSGKRLGSIGMVFRPILFAGWLVLVAALAFVDLVWRLTEFLARYLLQLAAVAAQLAKRSLSSPVMWRSFATVVAGYTLASWFVGLLPDFAAAADDYLGSSLGLAHLDGGFRELARLAYYFIPILFGIVLLGFFLNGWSDWTQTSMRAAFAGVMLLLAFFSSGVLLKLLSSLTPAEISGFEGWGAFSSSMFAAIGLGLLSQMARWLLELRAGGAK